VQQQGNAQLQGSSSTGSLQQELNHQGLVTEDPLQALATGKYAPARTSLPFGDDDSSPFVTAGCVYNSPEQPVQVSLSCSPKSILSYYVPNVSSLSREVSSDSGMSVPGGEEAMSRDSTLFEPTRRSQTLDLAKKLRSSLGSKFADSLRETIKEVVMKHDTNAWPTTPLAQQSLEDNNIAATSGEPVSQSHGWKNNDIANHSSLLAFDGVTTLDTSETLLKPRTLGAEHSKRLSWFSQENLSQSAIAELSWGRPAQGVSTPSASMDTGFFTPGHTDMNLCAVLKEPGAKESWTDCSSMPGLRSASTRRYVFPQAAALGTCRLDSLNLQQSNPNFRLRGESGSQPSLFKKANGVDDQSSFLDVSKGLGRDCESLLEFLNPGLSSRHRFYAKQAAAKGSRETWHEEAFSSYYGAPALELPELAIEPSRGAKRSRDDAPSVQLSKRQCLLDVPIHDDGAGVKADSITAGGFEEYLANLAAAVRVPSSELPGSPLTNLLEDFNQDSIVPIHLT